MEAVISLHLLQDWHLLNHLLREAFLLCSVENLDLDLVFFFFVICNSLENFFFCDLRKFWNSDTRAKLVNFTLKDFTLWLFDHVRLLRLLIAIRVDSNVLVKIALNNSASSGLKCAWLVYDLFVAVHIVCFERISTLLIKLLKLLGSVFERIFNNELHCLQKVIESHSSIGFHGCTAQCLPLLNKLFEDFFFWCA